MKFSVYSFSVAKPVIDNFSICSVYLGLFLTLNLPDIVDLQCATHEKPKLLTRSRNSLLSESKNFILFHNFIFIKKNQAVSSCHIGYTIIMKICLIFSFEAI